MYFHKFFGLVYFLIALLAACSTTIDEAGILTAATEIGTISESTSRFVKIEHSGELSDILLGSSGLDKIYIHPYDPDMPFASTLYTVQPADSLATSAIHIFMQVHFYFSGSGEYISVTRVSKKDGALISDEVFRQKNYERKDTITIDETFAVTANSDSFIVRFYHVSDCDIKAFKITFEP